MFNCSFYLIHMQKGLRLVSQCFVYQCAVNNCLVGTEWLKHTQFNYESITWPRKFKGSRAKTMPPPVRTMAITMYQRMLSPSMR